MNRAAARFTSSAATAEKDTRRADLFLGFVVLGLG
jgi:hypothetical protein